MHPNQAVYQWNRRLHLTVAKIPKANDGPVTQISVLTDPGASETPWQSAMCNLWFLSSSKLFEGSLETEENAQMSSQMWCWYFKGPPCIHWEIITMHAKRHSKTHTHCIRTPLLPLVNYVPLKQTIMHRELCTCLCVMAMPLQRCMATRNEQHTPDL